PAEQLAAHAPRCEPELACPACAAARRERRDHAVADTQRAHGATAFDDATRQLVTHDRAAVESALAAEIRMQVGAADAGGEDLNDDVAVVDDHRIGNGR